MGPTISVSSHFFILSNYQQAVDFFCRFFLGGGGGDLYKVKLAYENSSGAQLMLEECFRHHRQGKNPKVRSKFS